MKVALISFCCLFVAIIGHSQHTLNPYYVIAGGFRYEPNASRFATYVQEQNYPATYGFNKTQGLYYVYVLKTDDKQFALQIAYRLRSEGIFKKAWIYNGKLEETAINSGNAVSADESIVHDEALQDNSLAESAEPRRDQQPREANTPNDTEVTGSTPEAAEQVQDTTSVAGTARPKGKAFLFKLTNAKTGAEVAGHVKILKTERDTAYQKYPANKVTYIPEPESGKLVVVCNVVGYKFSKRTISYTTAAKNTNSKNSGSSSSNDQEVVVPFKLTPVKRWDFIELQEVYFHEKSAVMRRKSESELQELLNMMQQSDYKIRITGHTHQEGPVEITTLGESTNLFEPDELNEKKESNYKQLSQERAETVKRYLVQNGIKENRISARGMGASLAVYGHSEADNRIEIEILKD